MSLFSWLKTPKVIDTGLDLAKSLSSGIDMLILTDEERIKYQGEAVERWIKIQAAIADESSARSITRRLLAKNLVSAQLILLFWAGLVFKFDAAYSAFLLELSKLLMPWVGSIIAFYFVYYGIKSAMERK